MNHLYDDDNVPLGPMTWWDRVRVTLFALAAGAVAWFVLWAGWTVTH